MRKRILKAAAFCSFAFYALRVHGEPAVFVEKTVEAQQIQFVIAGSGLPEMRSITIACTYAVPHASIMDAIVSSPQPATAISVLVDTATSSMSVSVHAVSTLSIPDNARIVVLKMNNPANNASWFLTFAKALIIDKQGASVELPVAVKTLQAEKFAHPSFLQNTRMPAGRVMMFSLNGRKAPDCGKRNAPGFYLKSIGFACKTGIISVR